MNQRIAIPTNEGKLWQHFGKALAEQGCTDVLCGGLGQGAVNLLNELGIRIHAGAPELPVEQVLAMYLNGTIVYGDSSCHHHCEGHHHE